MSAMNGFFLAIASAVTLKTVGLWLIILGLVAEAAVIIFVPSGSVEKSLSVTFTLVIALGVWVEHIGAESIAGPRVLTQEQRGRIVDKLKQFSGTEYDVAISDSEPEILDLVLAIELVLSTAGWTELDWKGTGQALIRGGKPLIRLGASVTNVWIGTHTGQPDKLFEFALALSNALKAEGVEAVAKWLIPHEMSSTNANAIHILMGRKQ